MFVHFRKRSVIPPKLHNVCTTPKSANQHQLAHKLRISPNLNSTIPEETFLPEKSGKFFFGLNPQILYVLQNGCIAASGKTTRFLALIEHKMYC